MGQLLTKDGVRYFQPMPQAGQAILDALALVAAALPYDLTVTSAADGQHSGPSDPHHLGLAYDVRSKGLPDKGLVLTAVLQHLAAPGESPAEKDMGLVTRCFFGWLEAEGLPNEHFHFQLRRGVTYP